MKLKKIGILGIMLLLFGIALMNTSSAQQSVVRTVMIDPENPIRGTGFTMTVEFEMANIDEVFVFIQECDAETGICFFSNNLTMNLQDPQMYRVEYSFDDDSATYFTYHFNIKTVAGTWIQTEDVRVDLIADPSANGDENGSDASTPGFGIIATLASIALIVYLFERKRSQ